MCFGGIGERGGKTTDESCQSRRSTVMTLEIAAGGDVIFAAFLPPPHFPSSYVPPTTPNKKSVRSFGPVMFNRLMRLSYCINDACARGRGRHQIAGRGRTLRRSWRERERERLRETARARAHPLASHMVDSFFFSLSLSSSSSLSGRTHSSDNILLPPSHLPPLLSSPHVITLTYAHDDGVDGDYDDDGDDAAGRRLMV